MATQHLAECPQSSVTGRMRRYQLPLMSSAPHVLEVYETQPDLGRCVYTILSDEVVPYSSLHSSQCHLSMIIRPNRRKLH